MAHNDARGGGGGSLRRLNSIGSSRRYAGQIEHMPEIEPSDSASNAGQHRRAGSNSQRTYSEFRAAPERSSERRLERHTFTTKEHIQVRPKRPPARPNDASTDANGTTREGVRESPRENARDVRKERPAPEGNAAPILQRASVKELRKPVPWKPEASLLKHTSSPLASRVSIPPLANLLPENLEPKSLKDMSLEGQELAIIQDLLYVFMGFEGQYIRFSSSYLPTDERSRLVGPQYRILPGLDPSLRDLTRDMLKTASHYVAVETFVEVQSRDEFGTINHALCASIRKLLTDYLLMVAQLEHQMLTKDSFTLHVLHIHVMPTTNTMYQLYTLAQELLKKNKILEEEEEESSDDDDVDKIIEKLKEGGNLAPGATRKIHKGGNVLRLLTQRLAHFSGDPAARRVLEDLFRDASKPYMVMLNEWLHHGVIKDPHGEFLVREQRGINRDHLDEDFTDEYWEKRYTLRDGEVPLQLEGVKDKILLAGKYLNVVRECGGVDVSQKVQDVPRTFDDSRFLNNINDAYSHANASLLDLLLTKHELSARLRSMKHYFFLDRSDFFTYFMFLSKSELRKSARDVNVGKLQSLLDLVLRQPGSVASEDPYIDDVEIAMNEQTLTKFLMSVVNIHGMEEGEEPSFRQATPGGKGSEDDSANMNGYAALELKYTVPFPLSLVVSSKTVVRYQILFRYLVSLRYTEQLLVTSWEEHNRLISWTHKSRSRHFEVWKRRVWTLRGRMLNFVEQCLYYCTAEVIEPRWHELMGKVKDVEKSFGSLGLASGRSTIESIHETHRSRLTSKTVDELMHDHVDFLDTCLKECMLMNPKLLKVRDKLLWTCSVFAGWTSKLSRDICAADESLAGTPEALNFLEEAYSQAKRPVPDQYKKYDAEAFPKINEMLDRYEDNFNRHMKILLDVLDYFAATETVALGRLCAQLTLTSEKGGEIRSLS